MIASSYLLILTLELLYRSDIMTDTENDCKQKIGVTSKEAAKD